MSPSTVKVEFPGAQGTPLSARLDLPAGPPAGFALFAHCFTCSKDSKASAFVSAALAERGFGVLRFDFTGLGGSAGDFGNSGFSSNVADLVAAAAFLRLRYRAPELLVGHSLGGAAVLAAAPRLPEAKAVATLAAPFEPAHVLHQIPDHERIVREGAAEVEIAGRRFRIARTFVDDVASHRLAECVAGLRKALLVMHSPRDDTVDIENATRIFVAAKHPKSFVSLDHADHLLTRREDAQYAGHVIAAWAERYVAAPQPDPAARAEGKVVVRETREGRFTQQIAVGRHVLRADEPASVEGGLDTGPSPYDLLLAGLGACTAMTLRLYAEHKKLPLERVTVELDHSRIHAADCATCETREGKVDRIERLVRLEGPLDDAQRAKLLEIAGKCPVHRTLHGEIDSPARLAAD